MILFFIVFMCGIASADETRLSSPVKQREQSRALRCLRSVGYPLSSALHRCPMWRTNVARQSCGRADDFVLGHFRAASRLGTTWACRCMFP